MNHQQQNGALLADGLLLAFLRPIMIKKLLNVTGSNCMINSFKNFDQNYTANKR